MDLQINHNKPSQNNQKNQRVIQQLNEFKQTRKKVQKFQQQIDDIVQRLEEMNMNYKILQSQNEHRKISSTFNESIDVIQKYIEYQNSIINNLSHSVEKKRQKQQWKVINHEINEIDTKLNQLLNEDELISKLAKIETQFNKIQQCHQKIQNSL